jgi:hypothetical protein
MWALMAIIAAMVYIGSRMGPDNGGWSSTHR